MRRLTALALVLFTACTPAGAGTIPRVPRAEHVSPLAGALAEASFVDAAAKVFGYTTMDDKWNAYHVLEKSLEQGIDHCQTLDQLGLDIDAPEHPDYRNRFDYLHAQLEPGMIFGFQARLIEAAIEHLCPEHVDLLG